MRLWPAKMRMNPPMSGRRGTSAIVRIPIHGGLIRLPIVMIRAAAWDGDIIFRLHKDRERERERERETVGV